jgi:hypothetical protein
MAHRSGEAGSSRRSPHSALGPAHRDEAAMNGAQFSIPGLFEEITPCWIAWIWKTVVITEG